MKKQTTTIERKPYSGRPSFLVTHESTPGQIKLAKFTVDEILMLIAKKLGEKKQK